MKMLLYFFARYLLAPLFVAIMIFVLTGIKTIKSKLSLKEVNHIRSSGFHCRRFTWSVRFSKK